MNLDHTEGCHSLTTWAMSISGLDGGNCEHIIGLEEKGWDNYYRMSRENIRPHISCGKSCRPNSHSCKAGCCPVSVLGPYAKPTELPTPQYPWNPWCTTKTKRALVFKSRFQCNPPTPAKYDRLGVVFCDDKNSCEIREIPVIVDFCTHCLHGDPSGVASIFWPLCTACQ